MLYTDARIAHNLGRFTFLDSQADQFWRDWDEVADDLTAHLRAASTTPYGRTLTDLVGELSTRSDTFHQLWACHDVRACVRGTKPSQHPVRCQEDRSMAEPLRTLSIAFFEGRLTPASKLGRFQYGPFPRRSARVPQQTIDPGVA